MDEIGLENYTLFLIILYPPLQINIVQGVVAEINKKTGESECQFYKERLIYLDEDQKDSLIDDSRIVCCHGELKNNRGLVRNVVFFKKSLLVYLFLPVMLHSTINKINGLFELNDFSSCKSKQFIEGLLEWVITMCRRGITFNTQFIILFTNILP